MIASAPILLQDVNLPFSRTGSKQLSLTKSNILLAGGNKAELLKIASYLGGNYNFFIARNAGGAFKIINAHAVHLVISGKTLDGMDGSQFCLSLKSSQQHFHIPVILVSERATFQSKLNSLEAGADAFLESSAPREMFVAQVNNILANRSRIRNYFANTLFAHVDNNDHPNGIENFVQNLHQCISENMADTLFCVDCLAKNMNMSRPTLYRKVQFVLKMTPNELINDARLKKAAELLSTSNYQVCEIVKLVGFNSRSNFGKAFIKKFNITPTAYQQLKKGV